MRHWIRYALLALVVVVVLACTATAEDAETGLLIYFLDVGQGDATILLCDGEAMMIDGGDVDHSQYVYSFLQNTIQLDHIDIMVATHPHSDHIGGLPAALNACSVDVIYTAEKAYNKPVWENVVKYADKQGTPIVIPYTGDEFSLGSAEVKILGPVHYSNDLNNLSLILKITYGNRSFLFAGDAEWDEEHDLINSGVDLAADVLHVSHHGSRTGSGYQFLRAVAPRYGIISVGKGNQYGHPHEEALSRLHDADVQVFRTDVSGTIMCYCDGNDIEFTEHFE